jgi:hypothetical protein
MTNTKQFYRIWFHNGTERTAMLIVDTDRYPLTTTIEEYSRLFPYYEARLMKRAHRSDLYPTWEEAFRSGPKDGRQ